MPVTRRAVEQRLGRLLAAEGKQLRRTRGEIAVRELGTYYVVTNGTVAPINLEAFARETGALADYERLITED